MNKILALLFPALCAITCVAANPVPVNPFFSWRTLDQAQAGFAASNAVATGTGCIFSNLNSTLVFYNGSRKAEIDGVTVWLNVAPDLQPPVQQWRMAAIDMDLISLMLLARPEKKLPPLKVMLDPGHGGDDSGAVSPARDLYEKDINLELARRVGKILHRKGLKVRYTREHDTTLSLSERSALARKEKADLFISIHANNASNTNACGVETFVLPPSGYHGTADGSPARGWQIGNRNDYNNNLLGYAIHRELTKLEHSFDRGLKRQSFFVLRETHCPSVLVETGFLSNPDDVRRLKDRTWQSACAERIANGILDYCYKVNSLNQAVADKRRRDAEASERWKDYLARKEVQRLNGAELKPDAGNTLTAALIKSGPAAGAGAVQTLPVAAAAAATAAVKLLTTAVAVAPPPALQPLPSQDSEAGKVPDGESLAIDLQELNANQVQSVATNIYLKNTQLDIQPDSGSERLKTLAEFYETGKVK